ncbi:MAG: cytochrome c biogenesis protein CcdA [Haloarculaceae archaeon]
MSEIETLRLGFAFSLGVGTFLAPCAFPLLPGYVAFYLGRGNGNGVSGQTGQGATAADGGRQTRAPPSLPSPSRLRRAVTVGVVTSLGFFTVYAVLAGVVFALGTSVLRDVSVLELVVGVIMILLGLAMASGRLDTSAIHIPLPERRRGPMGYFAFGVVYAAAAAGCTAGLFVGLVSLALASGPVGALALVGSYALGMSLLMIGVTIAAAIGRGALLGRLSANTRLVSRLGGVALVVAGLVQLYYFLVVFDGLRMFLG